jgi:hypothetical protein
MNNRSPSKILILLVLAMTSARALAKPTEYLKPSTHVGKFASNYKTFALKNLVRCRRSAESLQKRLATHHLRRAEHELTRVRNACSRLQVTRYILSSAGGQQSEEVSVLTRRWATVDALLDGDELSDRAINRALYELDGIDLRLRSTNVTEYELVVAEQALMRKIQNGASSSGQLRGAGSGRQLADDVASFEVAYKIGFKYALEKRDAVLATIIQLDIAALRSIIAVPLRWSIDQGRLWQAGDWLSNDLVLAKEELGLLGPN